MQGREASQWMRRIRRRLPGAWAEAALLALAAAAFLAGYAWSDEPQPGFQAASPPEGALRVVTWNLGGSGQGGHPLDDQALPHVAGTLRELDADLMLLQEVRDGEQLQRLAEAIGPGLQTRIADGEGSRVGALAKGGTLHASAFPGNSRLMLGIYRREDGPIAFANLHANAFSAEKRNRSLGLSVDILGRANTLPVILAGDLNLDLDLDKRRDLFSDDEHLDVETYNYIANRLLDTGRETGSTAEPDRRLDYIFVSPAHFQVLSAGPLKGRRIEDMDHDPVVADLRVKG